MSVKQTLQARITATILVVIASFGLLLLGLQALNDFTDRDAVPLTSNIMNPTIPGGSLVFTKKTPESELEVGDIITVQVVEDEVMIGRLTNINSLEGGAYSLTFIGDNKALPEPFPYQVQDMTSKVLFHIPVLGFLVAGISSEIGITLLTVIALITAIIYAFRVHKWVFLGRSTRRYAKARQKVLQARLDKELYMSVEDFRNLFLEEDFDTIEDEDMIDLEAGVTTR